MSEEIGSSGFGLVDIKGEGKPFHPDSFNNVGDMSDDWYFNQLKAYCEEYYGGININDVDLYCSRPEIFNRIKKEMSDGN